MDIKTLIVTALASIVFIGCQKYPTEKFKKETYQTEVIGGGCDGCELMYAGIPEAIFPTDTSAGWHEPGTRLVISGTVFKRDGKSPADGVILYYWQTDDTGKYTPGPGLHQEALRHGHIRGWIKTGPDGRYRIATVRPAPYPGEDIPAHIHLSVKEPNLANPYYVDDINFDDDLLLLPYTEKYPPENRGGSGIEKVATQRGVQYMQHDITLGLHVPGYPGKKMPEYSGLEIGDRQPSFMPFHAYGPDKGSRACPVCKYGRRDGILYFVGTRPNWSEIEAWLVFLEQEAAKRSDALKVYFIYGDPSGYSKPMRNTQLETLGRKLNITHTALTHVPSFSDVESECHLNQINPEVSNTFIIYRNGRIADKYLNLKPGANGFAQLTKILYPASR
ncbi:Intradiol ring-cleavage dioxygenases domain-containing protein [Flavobacterium longum]|uniref:dioxygenase family protein n=1 Tax=Flavobacterium longum TaxID=1299340 RepID=UPI0039EAE2F2